MNFIYKDPKTGKISPVEFKPLDVTAYDASGEEMKILCKCGKSGNMIMGKQAFLVRCEECGWSEE